MFSKRRRVGDKTMRKSYIHLIAAAVAIFTAVACEEYEEPDEFELEGVSERVKEDFYGRYSDQVQVTDVWGADEDSCIRIYFTDVDGLPCVAIYKGRDWMMTRKEYEKEDFEFLSQVPHHIARAYIRAGFDNEEYDSDPTYVAEIARRGFDRKVFEFNFTIPYEDGKQPDGTPRVVHKIYTVLLDDSGALIDTLRCRPNDATCFYDLNGHVDFIKREYPGSEIIAMINDGGDDILYIRDNGIRKTVSFDNDFYDGLTWDETVYRLADDFELPEDVKAEYARYQIDHPDFKYSEVYHVERKDGFYYGLTMVGNGCSTTVYFKG